MRIRRPSSSGRAKQSAAFEQRPDLAATRWTAGLRFGRPLSAMRRRLPCRHCFVTCSAPTAGARDHPGGDAGADGDEPGRAMAAQGHPGQRRRQPSCPAMDRLVVPDGGRGRPRRTSPRRPGIATVAIAVVSGVAFYVAQLLRPRSWASASETTCGCGSITTCRNCPSPSTTPIGSAPSSAPSPPTFRRFRASRRPRPSTSSPTP